MWRKSRGSGEPSIILLSASIILLWNDFFTTSERDEVEKLVSFWSSRWCVWGLQARPWLERSDPNPRKGETAFWGYTTEKKGNSKGWCGIRLVKNYLTLSSDYWAQYQSTHFSEVYLRSFLKSWSSRFQDTPILNNRIFSTSVHPLHRRCHPRCTEVPIFLLFKIGVSWSLEVHDSKNALG